MSGGAEVAGMAPAIGQGATAAELGTTAAGTGLANLPQMPLWQRGLMGALTGNKTYGAHAPMIHQAFQGLLKQQQKPQAPMAPAMAPMRPPMMGAPVAFPGLAPQMGQQPFGAPQQIPSMAPWMGGM